MRYYSQPSVIARDTHISKHGWRYFVVPENSHLVGAMTMTRYDTEKEAQHWIKKHFRCVNGKYFE